MIQPKTASSAGEAHYNQHRSLWVVICEEPPKLQARRSADIAGAGRFPLRVFFPRARAAWKPVVPHVQASLQEMSLLGAPPGLGSPGGSDGKESACNARDLGSIPGSGRSPGGGNGNLLQYSCLENSMDRGA